MYLVGTAVGPLGALVGGPLGGLIGARETLLIAVVGSLLANLWIVLSPIPALGEMQALEAVT